jgi:hypothetical protein
MAMDGPIAGPRVHHSSWRDMPTTLYNISMWYEEMDVVCQTYHKAVELLEK